MRTPRGPADWSWAQSGVRMDADAAEVESKLAVLRAMLPAGEASLWAEPEMSPEPELPGLLCLTMAVP